MRCQWLKKKRFPDGRQPEDRSEIETHLSGCPDCRPGQIAWPEVDTLLEQMPVFDPPPDMLAAIMAEVERQPAVRPGLRTRWSGWRAETSQRLERALGSELWNPAINLVTSFAAVLLFFTQWSRFSVVNQLLNLSQSRDGMGYVLQALNNQEFQDLMWSVKVGATGAYYSFLTYWIN
ncbi:MAG: hypothetical protein HPY50_01280 [Firmicutes bacterium]|nr:hypothetical protein [Bacillota bacterium]